MLQLVAERIPSTLLAGRSDGVVEAQAERGGFVDRGLRNGPPRSNGDDSEAVCEV